MLPSQLQPPLRVINGRGSLPRSHRPVNSVHRSLAYSIGGNYFGLVLQLASAMVLSRLLAPAEIGVFAIAAAISGLARAARDFGVGEFIIHREQLTERDLRGALALSLAACWGLGLLIAALSPLAARYFREPGIGEVMRVQALSFVLVPFGAVTMAWFQRQLIPQPQFVASILADITSFVVAVGCALQGLGHMSMAWSSLAGVAVTVAASVWYRPKSLPCWPSLEGLRDAFEFGKYTGGVNLLVQMARSAPELILGRVLNVESVALFSRANALVELFQKLVVRSIQPLTLPIFSRSQRENGSPLAAYLSSVAYVTVLGWPLLGFLALTAPAAIRLVYGPQWGGAVDLSRVLCAAAAVELVHRFGREGALARGRSGEANVTSVALQSVRVLGLFAAVPFGLEGACWGLLAAALAGALMQQVTLARTLGLRVGDLARSCGRSLVVSVVSCFPLATWLVVDPPSEPDYLLALLAGALLTAITWLPCLFLVRHPLTAEIRVLLVRRWRPQA